MTELHHRMISSFPHFLSSSCHWLINLIDWKLATRNSLMCPDMASTLFLCLRISSFSFFALLLVSVSPLLMWQIRELVVEVTLWHVSSLSEEISSIWNSEFISNWIISFSLKRLCFLQASLLTCLLALWRQCLGSHIHHWNFLLESRWALASRVHVCMLTRTPHLVFEPCWGFSLKHIVEESLDLPGCCFAVWPSTLICSSGRSPTVLNRPIPSSAPATAA